MGVTGECKGVVADNILKRARVCCGQSSLAQRCSHNAKERARRAERAESARGEGVARTGRTGLYVKGGRARCYLACSPDEISASSFRPSSLHSYLDLLLRVFLPCTPSSSSAFPRTPFLLLLRSLQRSCEMKNFFRARHCRTFDCIGISVLLSLSFSPLSTLSLFPSPFFSRFSFLFKSVFSLRLIFLPRFHVFSFAIFSCHRQLLCFCLLLFFSVFFLVQF